MPDELWIADLDRSFSERRVKHLEALTQLKVMKISGETSGKELLKKLEKITESGALGKAPILILLDPRFRKETVKEVIEWRNDLTWSARKPSRSPMIDFFVMSSQIQKEVRTSWSDITKEYPDDYHFCVIEDLEAEIIPLARRARIKRSFAEWGMVMSSNSPLQKMKKSIRVIANRDSTVLITGETGTGKELVAKAIHYNSPRKRNKFIDINCGALADNLLESELFGHEKGAFTGAIRQKIGKFEWADQGTLFLDEIGNISPAMQIKLLRVLQERQFEHVGGTKKIGIDVRIIAATNEDLEKAVQEGRFREDLYYRVNVIPIKVPPLRERGEGDILVLIEHLLMKESEKYGQVMEIDAQATLPLLLQHFWPGNVRELENVIERAITCCKAREDRKIKLEDIEQSMGKAVTSPQKPSLIFQYDNQNLNLLNRYNERELIPDRHREQIKQAINMAQGKLLGAEKFLKKAGFEKGISRGRLRNLLGLEETKTSKDPELSEWYVQEYLKT